MLWVGYMLSLKIKIGRNLANLRAGFALMLFLVVAGLGVDTANAARIKDIADVEGVRGNQLFGYGVVIGLNGTGDGNMSQFTTRSISNLLQRLGIQVRPQDVRTKNVASVIVTATLPAFVRPGTKIDVTLSSMGDSKSLQGGTLLFTPLKAADGNVYAVSQGPVSVGGFSVQGGGDTAQRNHPTVGTISSGAIVERSIPFDLFQSGRVRIVLREPDFTTMTHMVSGINAALGRPIAQAMDSGVVEVAIPEDVKGDPINFVSQVENVEIETDIGARVVVNERSGTVIMGENVRIDKVALAHGNLSIAIRSETAVSQPPGFSPQGQTAAVTNTDVTVGEENRALSVLGGDVTLADVVAALNALGASPRDLISIFVALKKAGALKADLIIM
jgi:flagellar P-ring protein precursor FlgI